MTNDTTFTLRLPSELKAEVAAISEAEARSTSMVFILLLRRGIEAYRLDGTLLDTKTKLKSDESADSGASPKKKSPGGRRS